MPIFKSDENSTGFLFNDFVRNLSLPAQTRAGASPVSAGTLSRTSNLRTDATAASPAAIDVTSRPPTAVVPTGPIAEARAPASNWPSCGPVFVNMLFTLVTRPLISSGVTS